jgi:large subunit ribosomal protein L17
MRHRKSGIKLGRTASHRKAMFRNMVTSLFKHERIQTTDTKAKELRGWADHLITLAKRGDLHARRQALSIIREKDVVHKLFENAEKRFGKLSGGYTRIVKLGVRSGDAAPMSLVELVSLEAGSKKTKKKRTVKRPKTAAPEKTVEKAAAPAPADADTVEETSAEPAVAPEEQAAEAPEPEAEEEVKAETEEAAPAEEEVKAETEEAAPAEEEVKAEAAEEAVEKAPAEEPEKEKGKQKKEKKK